MLRQGAATFVEALDLSPDALTLVWHSVMWQYLSAGEQQRITDHLATLGIAADTDRPLAHLYVEQMRRTPDAEYEFLVCLQAWPGRDGAAGEREVLGEVAPHGVPVTWQLGP